ncbi:hypothetical protein [Streptomyces sp. NPDC060027]|uniref:hypothetical protein n=1 Tax=Streptomyces sp. NPDC060027 TaxID=3347040 RepID=UPI0036A264D9
METVYSDTALTTPARRTRCLISSSSQPSVMLAMLEALAVSEGQRVLELGSGTGYNAVALFTKFDSGCSAIWEAPGPRRVRCS